MKTDPNTLADWLFELTGDDPQRLIGWLCGTLRGSHANEPLSTTVDAFKADLERQARLRDAREAGAAAPRGRSLDLQGCKDA